MFRRTVWVPGKEVGRDEVTGVEWELIRGQLRSGVHL